jgi:hypothetical protein
VKAIKQIVAAGMILVVGTIGVRASDSGGASGDDSDIKSIISVFRDQKAHFLAEQRDQHRSKAGKLRKEVREQVAAVKSATEALRQEMRQSIEEAKQRAAEQSRKIIQETAENARESRRAL